MTHRKESHMLRNIGFAALGAGTLALLVGSGCVAVGLTTGPSVDYQRAERATLVLEIDAPGSGAGATGVVIAPGLVLTAKHVADATGPAFQGAPADPKDGHIYGTDFDGNHHDYHVIWTSNDADLALFEGDTGNLPAEAVTCKEPKLGDDVVLLGHPKLQAKWVFGWGKIASDRAIDDTEDSSLNWGRLLVAQDAAIQGDSGGPVFNDKGYVWGLLVGGIPDSGTVLMQPLSKDCTAINIAVATHTK